MNSVLLATFAGLVAMVCWGSGDWLTSKLSKKHDKFDINFTVELTSLSIMLPVLLYIGKPLPSTRQLVFIGLISLMFSTAYLLLIKALSVGSAGIVVPLANTYALITLVLTTVFVGTLFTNLQVVAIVCIVAGACMLAYEKNKHNIPIRELHKQTLCALGAALLWGTGFFILDNTIIGHIAWQMLSGTLAAFMTTSGLILLAVFNRGKVKTAIKRAGTNKVAIIAGAIFQIGNIAFYWGSDKSGSLVIPAVVASGAPLVASGLAALIDKERLGLVKRIGAVVVVVGIVILNLV